MNSNDNVCRATVLHDPYTLASQIAPVSEPGSPAAVCNWLAGRRLGSDLRRSDCVLTSRNTIRYTIELTDTVEN